MSKLTRYSKRIKRIFISCSLVATFLLFIILPALDKSLFRVSVDYYIVSINGKAVGTANSIETAGDAMAEARLKYSREFGGEVLINPHLSLTRANVGFSERMSESELSSAIYSTLFENVVTVSKQEAYTVSVGDYSVNLASINDVAKLMDRLKERYDITGQFKTVLDPDVDEEGKYTVTFAKESEEKTAQQIVADMFGGNTTSTDSESDSGVIELYFKEKVSVEKNKVDESDVKSVADAYGEMSEKKELSTTYYVQSQDTLDVIAKKYQITADDLREQNPSLGEDAIIVPGQIINVNYSRSMVTVVTARNMTFEEDYLTIEYRDDAEADFGSNLVISGGEEGHRNINAKMIYENGVQTDREILSQTTTENDSPKVISVGIKVAGEDGYVRPISGGSLSHEFGEEIGDGLFHSGIDWKIDAGKSVVASSAGKVTKTGWYGEDGLEVEITAEDGTIFRFGFLSEINVSVGNTVRAGQEIGKTGSTGSTDEAALHYEIIKDGRAVNPLEYVSKN